MRSLTKRKLLKFLSVLTLLGSGGFLVVASCLYLYLSPKLPSVEELKEIELQIPLRIHSQDLKVIAEFGEKKRSPVRFEEIPQPMIDAFLAAEDDSFFEHRGIVISGLARAAVELVTTGSIRSGGSTITMQVARNFFLSKRQEFTRKFNEILLAFRIEEELSKQEILSLYTNKIYMGNRAYGVGAAAQVYYGKTLDQLSLGEIATIAGLPKAPSRYNPLANAERATQRRDWILGRMLSLGNINQSEYQAAKAEVDEASYHGSISEMDAAYAAEMVRQEVVSKFGLKAYTEGYTAITTLDSALQSHAVTALQAGIMAYDQRHGYRGVEQKALEQDSWAEVLRKTPIYGGLEPAIITEVADDHLQLATKDGLGLPLNWADGLDGLRTYRTVNARSAPITAATDLFVVGDLIRIQRHLDDRVSLAQLPEAQAAMVTLAPNNGGIKALVGGFDYRQSRFNRITQATRQPGSNFKPFIYTTALSSGFTAASIINDAPVVFDDSKLEDTWRPENDGGKFYGPTRLREALYRSRNLVSIRLLRRMGIDRTLEGLQSFGFKTSEMPLDLSLALGSHALTPLEIAAGYAVFANGGFQVNPYILDKVIDRHGTIIYQATPATACNPCVETVANDTSKSIDFQLEELLNNLAQESLPDNEKESWEVIKQALQTTSNVSAVPATRVIDEQTAFLIDSMLKDVILRGTGVKAKILNRTDLAGKTGTTNGPRDAWFSGYSPDLVTTAWVGFDNNALIGRNEYGGSAALPIWIDFMGAALAGKPAAKHPQPNGIVRVKIDAKTGKRVAPNQTGIYEFFRTKNVPELINTGSNVPTDNQSPLPEDLF
ncbi:MAG: penicillin-binding protein 1A [Porticoccaceae bacterium]|nr:penicillin-binding protein 1A [Porticoccaceae bacterium]